MPFFFNVTEDICQEIKQQGMMGKGKNDNAFVKLDEEAT